MDQGFDILPINPTKEEILGKPVLKSLLDTDLALHTLTIYVQPSRLKNIWKPSCKSDPNASFSTPAQRLRNCILSWRKRASRWSKCTLVMLQTGSFGGSDSSLPALKPSALELQSRLQLEGHGSDDAHLLGGNVLRFACCTAMVVEFHIPILVPYEAVRLRSHGLSLACVGKT